MRLLSACLTLLLGLTACAHDPSSAPRETPSGAGPSQWLTYQAGNDRRGAVPAETLHPTARAWEADLGAAVRGEVLAFDGRLVAATEGNRVVALSPRTGRVLWSRTLGRPLTNTVAVVGCGNIDPLGITGTPAIDSGRGLVYVVAEIWRGGSRVAHVAYGLDVRSGAIRFRANVDPSLAPGERRVQLLQRAALAVANGRLYVAYGGHIGDCGSYHGWVVSVPAAGGSGGKRSFMVARDSQGGAIWQSGGGPAVDHRGRVYVATGNTNPWPQGPRDPGRYAESIVQLSPGLRVLAAFKDPIASQDADLSTGNPVLVPDGVFSVGKTDVARVLGRQRLHVLTQVTGVCGADPDGGPAYDAARRIIVVPCEDGSLQVVRLGDGRLGPRLPGANSTVILVGDRYFAADYEGGHLSEYDAATFRLVHRWTTPALPHFASPSAAFGQVYLGTDTGVVAFR